MASTQDETRPARPRVLSFGGSSHKSHKSSGSVPKVDLLESPREKMARRITGKADPSVAIREDQPAMRQLEKSTMAPLRSMEHRDSLGNVITDPDRSNPTRPRMERPLDTIRSFESAIDSSYTRRYSAQPDMQSRRASYHQGYGPTPRTPGAGGSYFDRQGDRTPNSRPDSMYGEFAQNDRGYPNGAGYSDRPQRQQRRYPPRNQSDPMMYGDNGAYGYNAGNGVDRFNGSSPAGPIQWTHPAVAQASQDTTGTNSTSGSYATDQGTNSTEASLHNSSYGELPQQNHKPQPPQHDAYANGYPQFSGQSQSQGYPAMAEAGYGSPMHAMPGNRAYPPQQNGNMAPPPPPAHRVPVANGNNTLRKPAPTLAASRPAPQTMNSSGSTTPKAEKRKSWLKRRFSKKD